MGTRASVLCGPGPRRGPTPRTVQLVTSHLDCAEHSSIPHQNAAREGESQWEGLECLEVECGLSGKQSACGHHACRPRMEIGASRAVLVLGRGSRWQQVSFH